MNDDFPVSSVIDRVTDQDIENDLPPKHSIHLCHLFSRSNSTMPAHDVALPRATFALPNSFCASRHAVDHRKSSFTSRETILQIK